MIDYSELVEAIINGNLDERLDSIWNLIKERKSIQRKLKATKLASELKVGDSVRISSNVSPKKLAHMKVEILEINPTTARVQITDHVDKLSAGKRGYGSFKLPLNLVEKD